VPLPGALGGGHGRAGRCLTTGPGGFTPPSTPVGSAHRPSSDASFRASTCEGGARGLDLACPRNRLKPTGALRRRHGRAGRRLTSDRTGLMPPTPSLANPRRPSSDASHPRGGGRPADTSHLLPRARTRRRPAPGPGGGRSECVTGIWNRPRTSGDVSCRACILGQGSSNTAASLCVARPPPAPGRVPQIRRDLPGCTHRARAPCPAAA